MSETDVTSLEVKFVNSLATIVGWGMPIQCIVGMRDGNCFPRLTAFAELPSGKTFLTGPPNLGEGRLDGDKRHGGKNRGNGSE